MDTLVDPVEVVSWSQVSAAPRVDPTNAGPRASFQSVDPEAQVQWFARPHANAMETTRRGSSIEQEPSGSVDIDISWEISGDDETDVEPTLVIRKRVRS